MFVYCIDVMEINLIEMQILAELLVVIVVVVVANAIAKLSCRFRIHIFK